jgi:hypothetical protein
MRSLLARALLCACPLTAALAPPALAQQPAALEYRVKAAYLLNFARYVEWPEGSLPAEGPLRICVLGVNPFGRALEDLAAGRTSAGREIAVSNLSSLRDAKQCAIVYISPEQWRRRPVPESELRALPALVVGDGRDFARRGGTIGFVIADETVRFVVNLEARDRAGLRISSRVLALATDLYGRTDRAP